MVECEVFYREVGTGCWTDTMDWSRENTPEDQRVLNYVESEGFVLRLWTTIFFNLRTMIIKAMGQMPPEGFEPATQDSFEDRACTKLWSQIFYFF